MSSPISRLGHFTDNHREYVLTDPFPPRAWHNYLCNGVYLANLTQHGTGGSFWQPRGEGLRANVTEDRDGSGGPRFVYLRDNESAVSWTATGAPAHTPMDAWECRIGLGYQINRASLHGIETEWLTFVPPNDEPGEFWRITVRNLSDRTRRISVFPYLEMHLTGGSTLMDFIAVLGGRYEPDSRAVFGINACVKFPPRFKAFLASDSEVAGATVSRDEFLGRYRDYRNPIAVERGDVHNPEAGTEWLGASLRHELELAPGEERTLHCLIGVVESVEEGKEMIRRLLAPGMPGKLLREVHAEAEADAARFSVRSPDVQFDRWLNVWLKHQLRFVGRWGRVIGRGFRDVLQDTFGHRLLDPALARSCLIEVFAKQFPDGRCIRAWRLPINVLDLQHYADSPSWMIMALSLYLKETADFEVLDERVPFLDAENPYAEATSDATVWEHVVLAQRHLLAHRGAHELSKIYYGDWCDTMNGVGKAGRGESVMLSMQVKWGCDQLAELARRRGDESLADEMEQASARLAKAINAEAWDGEWYVRAFDDEGVPVGSDRPPESDNGEGRIFLNAQSWAVISGVAPAERAVSALDAALRHLDTGYGMVLNWPAFTGLKPRIGQMTAMTPGFYENGSVYVHGNCFWIQALAMAGRGEECWRAFRAILPDTDNKPNADTEPFSVPNYYIGPNVDRRKQRNLYLSGWRTGSAAWLYQIGIEWILGARAEYDGLRIDPHLPEGFVPVTFTRTFRGATYEITIEGASGDGARLASITLDGQPVEGTLLPVPRPGDRHRVNVRLER